MSTPRTKRQFAGASADPAQRQITSFFNPRSASDVIASEAQKPVLSSTVEANLLSVGMRIRKSVPEGYKTEGPSAFKIWTDNSPLPVQSTVKRTGVRATSRELLPFCGINKVGGLDTQPDFVRDNDDVPDLDEVPGLTMSQESADGMDAELEPSRKRFFDDNDEEAAGFETFDASDRVLAIPQSRLQKSVGSKGIDQENMATDEDFEDAGFLVFQ